MRIIDWKDILKKVSFMFLFISFLSYVPAYGRMLDGSFRWIFLPWFPISFVEIKFWMLFPRTPPRSLWSGIPKWLFLALFSKYFDSLLFDLAESTRCSLNFSPNKSLSCCCNKSASSFNISLDCCAGQEGADKMLYLLKYVIYLLIWFNKSTVFSIYALILSKINGYLLSFGSTFLFH